MAMGRPSVFAPKDPKYRYQGITTKEDARLMELARKELAKLSGVKNPSDGDLFGYLARGRKATEEYLENKRWHEASKAAKKDSPIKRT